MLESVSLCIKYFRAGFSAVEISISYLYLLLLCLLQLFSRSVICDKHTKVVENKICIVNQKSYMENCLKDGRCSICNNAASEHTMKAYLTGRKNFLFHDTVKGATASAIVYTLAETAKVNGLSILEDLMPWSKMMQETCNLDRHSEI